MLEMLGTRLAPIGLWLHLIRGAQTYMEERADLGHSGIPLGSEHPFSCEHDHGYNLWLDDARRSVKLVLGEIWKDPISSFRFSEVQVHVRTCKSNCEVILTEFRASD